MKDEFEGMGGSYSLDPKTGKRKLIQRTSETPPTDELPAAPAAPVTPTKEER